MVKLMNKLSVVIPHYNDMENLERLISTIPKNGISIIVVDNTPFLSLENFSAIQEKNPNIKFYKSPNQGAGLARNLGIAKAETEWIVFADADDFFMPDFFRVVSSYFESDSDIIYFSPMFETEIVNPKDYRWSYKKMIRKFIDNPTKENEWKIRLTFDVPWSKMLRRQYILDKQLEFDDTKKQNDTIFAQKAGIFADKVIISNEVIYCAVDNNKSITHQLSKPYFEDALSVKIRSYNLKMKLINKKFLRNYNDLIYIEPIMTIIKSFKIYKEIAYTYKTYQIFREHNIPVFSFTVLHICLNKLTEKLISVVLSKLGKQTIK